MVIKLLRAGKIGVIPTDTIYGLVGQAFSKRAVEKIYEIKKRDTKKPFIILISSSLDLKLFGIKIMPETAKILKNFWPGPVSVLFSCRDKKLAYLHRGTNKLAFRLPKDKKLRNFLHSTGPLVAPSANHEGQKPAQNLKQAQKYFGDQVDFYIDGGKMRSKPSTLVEIKDGKIITMRK